MKTSIKTCIMLLFIVTLFSCSSDDDASTTIPEGYFFKTKIDGNSFSATIPEFGASKTGNTITIACVQGIHKFQLKINNSIGVGTYTIPTTTANTIVLSYENDVVVYQSGICGTSGTLTITAISSNEIAGTFTFSAGNTDDCGLPQKNITQGSFKALLAGS
ncbi:DUF6252 family protein [Flavobacterium sp. J27]|uniref:DUF6252 family protein n=1 Tax=Flavobacterium sp. J27 TaxID=2060419 RepID=UPI001031BAA7|nr:DUF6252 family protein [Flavobacterium sp. J27]